MAQFESCQQLFDFILKKIRAQGEPSMAIGGSCRYRTSSGLRCAAGWIIPDGEYGIDMEGRSFISVARHWPAVIKGLVHEDVPMEDVIKVISACQQAHDVNAGSDMFMERFEENMMDAAQELDLDYTPPKGE